MFARMLLASNLHALVSLPEWKKQVCVLHSHEHSKPVLIALGVESAFHMDTANDGVLSAMQTWMDRHNDWIFGFLSYDVKNAIENLESRHPNNTLFPDIHFFIPQVVIRISGSDTTILKNTSSHSSEKLTELLNTTASATHENESLVLKPRISREEYIESVVGLLRHIQLGDIYEVNYCQEFFSHDSLRDPYLLWARLNGFTEAPFAAYLRSNNLHLMCASPERFIRKQGDTIISQPIKGTIRRGNSSEEDAFLQSELKHNQKERSENVMIVDLVRNDLSHFAEKGSVSVEELFGIHTFKTVHHMISTVTAKVRPELPFQDILRAMFPMGSMTGAPKIKAMQLIDQYEYNRRGIYSGSVGYISPEGDFDFNVVIRSLVYNESLPYLSCCVGSAITSLCDPQKEYEECLLKAEALFRSLRA